MKKVDRKNRLNRTNKEVRRRKRTPSTVVFWRDYENQNLYTAPFEELGSKLVTPEELEQAQKDFENVIIVSWRHGEIPEDSLKNAFGG